MQLIRTEVINPKLYVDLVQLNGKLKTFVMKKSKEPNFFETQSEYDGDKFEEMVEHLKRT